MNDRFRNEKTKTSGTIIYCINPGCKETCNVEGDGGDINSVMLKVRMTCGGGANFVFHWRLIHGPREALSAEDVGHSTV